MKIVIFICLSLFVFNVAMAQQSEKLRFLVDSLPPETLVLLNFQLDSGFMAAERVAISNDGNELYYGVRNGYDSSAIANILKITYTGNKWSKPGVVFPDSCGAPALSDYTSTC